MKIPSLLFPAGVCVLGVLLAGTARAQSHEDRIGMQGVALPRLQVMIRSTIPGQIHKIPVREGQWVSKGDVLVELDSREAVARKMVAALEAGNHGVLNNALAELEYAKLNFERIARLFGDQASNEREHEEARLRYRMAQAAIEIERERLAVARARHDLATVELSLYTIRAPFDGFISQTRASQGQAVTELDDLLEVVSLDKLRVELFLPVEWAGQLAVGTRHELDVAHPFNRSVPATVTYQSQTMESTSGTLRFVLEIDNRELQLPAGISATLHRHPGADSVASGARRATDWQRRPEPAGYARPLTPR